jgi:hypothetical protein
MAQGKSSIVAPKLTSIIDSNVSRAYRARPMRPSMTSRSVSIAVFPENPVAMMYRGNLKVGLTGLTTLPAE